MSVTIRLSRAGAKKRPYYRIVVTDSRSPRDGRFIEKVGTYNPLLPQDHADRVVLKAERIQHWIKNGVVISDRCQRLFFNAGLISTKPGVPSQTKKDKPKAKAQERAKMEAEAAAKAAEAAAAPAEA